MVCGSLDHRPFREQDGYTIVRCTRCGLRFMSPQPSELELADLYGEAYYVSVDSRERGYDGYVTEAENCPTV